MPINTDALPPAQRPSSPFPRLPPRVLHARHRSDPSLRPRKGLLRRQGLGGVRSARFQQAREKNQSAQAASNRSRHLGLAPWGTDEAACVFLGCSEAPEEERVSGSDVGWGSQRAQYLRTTPEYMQRDLSTMLKKFPIQRAHLRSGEKPSLQQAPSPALCGDPLVRSGESRVVTLLGLT